MELRNKLIILIGIFGVIVVGGIALFFLSRSSSEVSTIFGKIERPDVDSVLRLQSKKLTIDFKTPQKVPTTAQVFKIRESEISREVAEAMALNLGFTVDPKGRFTLTWTQGNKILDIDLDNRYLNFRNQSVKSLKGKFSTEKLAEKALKFIKQKGLPTDGLAADTVNFRLLEARGDELEAVSDSKNPVFIEIGFNRALNEYNVFYPNPTEPAAVVSLNNKGQIFWLYYKFGDINKKTSGTYPLVDIKKLEIAKLIRFGDLVYPQTGKGVFEPALIKTIAIEDFSLAYLDDQVGEFVQPVYILRGFATVGKENISVVVYYPALEERWLK